MTTGAMRKAKQLYEQYRNVPEQWLFPMLLVLYPLLRPGQGMDVTDTTYSLANFQYFDSMNGTWMVATYLANVLGSLLMKLPGGDTFLGICFYTTLLQSLTALAAYKALSKVAAPILVFLGEWIALGLCWCPSAILYNYLTYLLLTGGMLLLYQGICMGCEAEGERAGGLSGICRRKQILCYVSAGVLLGANIAVRMPNIVQMALIAALWYGIWLRRGHGEPAEVRRHLWDALWRDTLWCAAGYFVGFALPFLTISLRYGWSAYAAMVQNMFAMTDKAVDYKPSAMLTDVFADYGKGVYWLIYAFLCMAAGFVCVGLGRRCGTGASAIWKRRLTWLGRLCYLGMLLLLLRFYWGRGVFSFRYYEYSSIYYPAVLLLLLIILAAFGILLERHAAYRKKVLAVLVLIQIFVTPLGSNNDLYPIINAMFVALPFALWVLYDWGKACCGNAGFLWRAPVCVLCLFVLIQSIGFHVTFVFGEGAERTMTLRIPAKAEGVRTTQENGEALEQLALFVTEEKLQGQSAILYGDIPGIGYLLDLPSALSTFWADLDSFRVADFEQEMNGLEEQIEREGQTAMPLVIVSAECAAYLNQDQAAMEYYGVDEKKRRQDEKLARLGAYMEVYGYTEIFGNARYVVYSGNTDV